MRKIESPQACEGTQGEYRLLAHYLASWQVAKLVELKLGGSTTSVESQLGLPNIDNPFTILALAENVQGVRQHTQMKRLERPAITTIMRICNRANHADSKRTGRESHRLERAAAVVWVPEAAGRLTVHAKKVELSSHNIGSAWSTNSYIGERSPVVSTFLTQEEQKSFERQSTAEIVNALPSSQKDNQIFALLHEREDGTTIEQIYTFPYTT